MRDPAGVDAGFIMAGAYELDVADDLIPATVVMKPPYDPAIAKVKR